jgi:hypothetical protein
MINCAGIYGAYYKNTATPSDIMDMFLNRYAANSGHDNYDKVFHFDTSIWLK